MQLLPIDQPCFHTLQNRAHKQALKDFLTPARSRFTEHAMIGNLLIERVTQKAKVIEPLGDDLHQLALARHIIKEKQKHHIEDDHWINRDVTVVSVAVRHILAHKANVNRRLYSTQDVIAAHSLLQVDRVVE